MRVGRHIRANAVGYLALFIALSGTAWAAATIGPRDIKDDAVRSRHIEDGAVASGELKGGAVTAGKVGLGAVGTFNIAADSVTSGHVGANELTGDDIGEGSLDTGSFTAARSASDAGCAPSIDTSSTQTCVSVPVSFSQSGRAFVIADGRVTSNSSSLAGCQLRADGGAVGFLGNVGQSYDPNDPDPQPVLIQGVSGTVTAGTHTFSLRCGVCSTGGTPICAEGFDIEDLAITALRIGDA